MTEPTKERIARRLRAPLLAGVLLPALLALAACNGNTFTTPSATVGLNTYFSPATTLNPSLASTTHFKTTLGIDHTVSPTHPDPTFTQTGFEYSGFLPTQGSFVASSGTVTTLPRGLLSLGTLYQFTGSLPGTTYKTPQTGSFAVELPAEGGFSVLQSQPVVPFVITAKCPTFAKPETFLFLTLPAPLTALPKKAANNNQQLFNLTTDAAYGTVSISEAPDGSIALSNVVQSFFPVASATTPPSATPPPTAPATYTGVCSPGIYGSTIAVPAISSITGVGTVPVATPPATLGISPGGLLVEDDAVTGVSSTASPAQLTAANVLGAGVGTVGLPVASSAVSPATLASTQFQGFFLDTGTTPSGAKSLVASFGFATQPTTCPTVAAPTGSLLVGGDYPSNDPTKSTDGYGNCDWAIDLGVPDATTNGLFPAATVYPNRARSYPAVIIAGQIAGKYALFVLGADGTNVQATSRQAHGIYLLQSN